MRTLGGTNPLLPMQRSVAGLAVHLLWTGGWDSTYRLLSLVLVEGARVQPHYIADTSRRSTLLELRTMHHIRQAVAAVSPEGAARIAPTRIVSVHDIAPAPEITARRNRLTRRAYLGGQYDWLARFAAQFDIPALELCIHVDDKAHAFISEHVEQVEGEYWQLRKELVDTDLSLFRYFRFPVLHLTKLEMDRLARQHGFHEIMQKTWFCHSPWRGRPCGICNPCVYTAEEGMAHRLRPLARLSYTLLPVLSVVREARRFVRRVAKR
ncbi:hypothetical protein BH20GEM2_BH20GEM2_11140 [soil metagenome]